jgi:hypothetical protein
MTIMKTTKTAVLAAIASVLTVTPGVTSAQIACPPEVEAAKNNLNARQAAKPAPRQLVGARSQDVQAPRAEQQQAPRGQDVQAPRGQDVQAPRGQDVQAPRGQDVQAPRGEPIQAPRTPTGARQEQDGRGSASPETITITLDRAQRLVADAEGACARNDMAGASSIAKMALDLMKTLD